MTDRGSCCEKSLGGAQSPPKAPPSLLDRCSVKITIWDGILHAPRGSKQPMIQRQLTSEALNSAQMLEVCVLWRGGGGGAHSKGESSFFLLPMGGTRCTLKLPKYR